MARDDRLRKVQGAGADFLETARAKAEDFLKELSKAGGDTQGRAQGALDDLVGGGRRSTEQFVTAVRHEIQNQLGALGLATKSDLAALERRLSGRVSAATSPARTPAKAAKTPAKAAKTTSKTTAKRASQARSTPSSAPSKAGGTTARPGRPAKGSTAAKKTTPRKAPAAKKAAKKAAG